MIQIYRSYTEYEQKWNKKHIMSVFDFILILMLFCSSLEGSRVFKRVVKLKGKLSSLSLTLVTPQ